MFTRSPILASALPAEGGGATLVTRAARTYHKMSLNDFTEEQLLENYAPIISQMVNRFAPLAQVAVDTDDLRSIACLSLIQAAHSFDPAHGLSFEIYCRMRIRGAILDELRKSQPLSRSVYSRRREVEQVIESLREEKSRQPTEDEIATRLGVTLDAYQRLLEALRPVVFIPLHQAIEGDAEYGIRAEHLSDLTESDPSDHAGAKELHQLIRERILQLNQQQKKVLTLFYYEGLRMKDIAELLNVSESRICQVHTEAMLSLRSYLRRKEQKI